MGPRDIYFQMLPGESDGRPCLNAIAPEVPLSDDMAIKSPGWWVMGISGLHQGGGTDSILEGCIRLGHVEKMRDKALEAPRKKKRAVNSSVLL